jgi:hypothetical protein
MEELTWANVLGSRGTKMRHKIHLLPKNMFIVLTEEPKTYTKGFLNLALLRC